MLRITTLLLLLGTGIVTAREVPSETFVIQAGEGGGEAIVKIPVGAVSAFSAVRAVALTDVRIHVIGAPAPIQIRADRIVLELTADEAPTHWLGRNLRAHSGHRVQSAQVIVDNPQTQTFVGHVVFTEQTPSGALEIKADRLERLTGPFAGV